MDTVFKYCDPHGGLNILKTLELKVTPPDQFNDPFEFTPHITSSNPRKEAKRELKNKSVLREMYIEAKQSGHAAGSFREYRKLIESMRSELSESCAQLSEEMNSEFQKQTLPEVSTENGVLCLTDKPTSIVMWGHYAQKHQGLVIGLDAKWGVFQDGLGLRRVNYSSERVPWDTSKMKHVANSQDDAADLILSKNCEWEYESEYRQMFRLSSLTRRQITPKPSGETWIGYFLAIPPEVLRTICLGTKSSPQMETAVRNLLRKPELTHVTLQKARLHRSQYSLELETISKK